MTIHRTPRPAEIDTRYAVIDGHANARLAYLDSSEDVAITPERREEIRALAILANDKVRMRNESETPDGDVEWWVNFGRHAEDLCLIRWFRPETGIAYVQTTGCWEGRVLAADIGLKPVR